MDGPARSLPNIDVPEAEDEVAVVMVPEPKPRSKWLCCISLTVIAIFFAIIVWLAVAFTPDLSYVNTGDGSLGSGTFISLSPTQAPTTQKPSTVAPTKVVPPVSAVTFAPSVLSPTTATLTLPPHTSSPNPASYSPSQAPTTLSPTIFSAFSAPTSSASKFPSTPPSHFPSILSPSLLPSILTSKSIAPSLVETAPTIPPSLRPSSADDATMCSLNKAFLMSSLCPPGTVCASHTCRAINSTSDQAGNLVITEFRVGGGQPFIEIYNPGSASIDIFNYIIASVMFQGSIRSISDPSGQNNPAVIIAPKEYAYGMPNTGDIRLDASPLQVKFVWGDSGNVSKSNVFRTDGDEIRLFSLVGLEDYLNFTLLHLSSEIKQPEGYFPAFSGRSTQLDPLYVNDVLSNDLWKNWCVTYFNSPSSVSTILSRVNDSAGIRNGDCSKLVINEVVVESEQDGQTFIELAGQGGALVEGYEIRDVNCVEGVCTLNSDGSFDAGETDGVIVLPIGTRMPVHGILILADGFYSDRNAQSTRVANFNPAVDLSFIDVDMQDGRENSILLLNVNGVQIDAIKYASIGGPSGAVPHTGAFYPSAASLCRSSLSSSSNNLSADFYVRCATPGEANSLSMPIISWLIPNDSIGSMNAPVRVGGSHLCVGMSIKVGESAIVDVTQSVPSGNEARIIIPANPNPTVPQLVNITYGFRSAVVLSEAAINMWTWTIALNGQGTKMGELDRCILKSPETVIVQKSIKTEFLYAWLYQAGETENTGPISGMLAEVGFGSVSTVPTSANKWSFFAAAFDVQIDGNHQYRGAFVAPDAGQYAYTYRFSRNNGLSWTYCDKDGSGVLGGPATFMSNLTVI